MASRKPASPAFRSRTSETYARIREAVISARFAPGTKLKIEELCSALEVGATPVREALSYLAADGLVVREEQRGFRVADISAQEFEDLLHVRCNVEERALRLAIERGDSVWEENIVSARYRLETLERPRGYNGAWEEAHRRFHLALNAACGSNILLRLCNQFYDENDRYRHIARSRSEESRDIAVEHEAIAEAALARDADEAVRQLLAHYRRTGEMLHRALVAMAGESEAPVSGARSGNGKGIQWQGV